jgi:hypothetical protein
MLLTHFSLISSTCFSADQNPVQEPKDTCIVQFQSTVDNFHKKHGSKFESLFELGRLSFNNLSVLNSFLNLFSNNLMEGSMPAIESDEDLTNNAEKTLNYLRIAFKSFYNMENKEFRQSGMKLIRGLAAIPLEDLEPLSKFKLVIELVLKIISSDNLKQELLGFREIFDFCGISINSSNLPTFSAKIDQKIRDLQTGYHTMLASKDISEIKTEQNFEDLFMDFIDLLDILLKSGYLYQNE